jgi:hypothetical protein
VERCSWILQLLYEGIRYNKGLCVEYFEFGIREHLGVLFQSAEYLKQLEIQDRSYQLMKEIILSIDENMNVNIIIPQALELLSDFVR